MPLLISIGIVTLSGAAGGIINALVSDKGFMMPSEETAEGVCVIRPGFAGNIFLGAVCALIFWGLYGTFCSAAAGLISADIPITISTITYAILLGLGGARWLTNKVNKKLLSTAANAAGASRASFENVQNIPIVTSARTFSMAKEMYHK